MQGHLSQERRDAPLPLAGQHIPNRRRQIAHPGIQANGPKRIALQSRFSAIRCVPSIYERYREWDIENFFNKLKHFRAVATRFEKHDANYLALVKLAAAKIWMRFIEFGELNPATGPQNCSLRRRSKPSRRTPSFDPPTGFVIAGSINRA